MRTKSLLMGGALIVALIFQLQATVLAEVSGVPVPEKERCPVCGMFVAKYPTWISQLPLSDGRVMMFDGPKDMFVYIFSPQEYGAGDAEITAVIVKDYYTQRWLDGKKAYYVTGSDVHGPMGHEFIPFEAIDAAENFKKDYHGKRILTFSQVTDELVQSMRKGHKMKMKKTQ